jgi:hypothetical protein
LLLELVKINPSLLTALRSTELEKLTHLLPAVSTEAGARCRFLALSFISSILAASLDMIQGWKEGKKCVLSGFIILCEFF